MSLGQEVSFGRVVREVDLRVIDATGSTVLSVSHHRGVLPRSELTDKVSGADDLSTYKRCWAGDIVLNRMRAFQGALGLARMEGIVSPDYAVLRSGAIDSRYLAYVMRSEWFVSQMAMRLRGIGSPGAGSVRTPRVNVADLADIKLDLPPADQQRRIAGFLDDQVTRIDDVVALRSEQSALIEHWRVGRLTEVMLSERADTVTLSSIAEVRLGRQRSPDRASADWPTRYLRSANVSDGRISLEDVLEMDFNPAERAVFALRRGDVLVTEGAGSAEAVGASAVWEGEDPGICFQNTLIRLRPRSTAVNSAYLGWWARTSHLSGAMRAAASGANILHLGSQGVAKMHVPVRSLADQAVVVGVCDNIESASAALAQSTHAQTALLEEFKRALITAAVTGEFEVSGSSGRGVLA